jgi:hypothetical protein
MPDTVPAPTFAEADVGPAAAGRAGERHGPGQPGRPMTGE